MTNDRQNIKWLEGIRGLASVLVILTHLSRAFDYSLWFPHWDENASPRLLQYPILRIPWQGRIGVTMFAFLTGYVCALKPLRQATSGNPTGALLTVARSAFRRPPRLVLPATFAMCITWCIAQVGGFDVANKSDSDWLRYSSPDVGTLRTEVPRLFHNFQTVWLSGRMEYDDHQWALRPLLEGAFMAYMALSVTAFMKFGCRVAVYAGLWMWFWLDNNSADTETFACQIFFGMILCSLSSHAPLQTLIASHPNHRRTLQTILLLSGLYVASYPGERPEWAPWSSQLQHLGSFIFPPDVNYGRRWSAIGWHLCATGIWLSTGIQGVLSNRLFMWLGKHSFAVYLTHGTMLRVVLVRMVYGWSGEITNMEKNAEGIDMEVRYLKRVGTGWFFVAVPVWVGMVYCVAWVWTRVVDVVCARITKRLEGWMFVREEEKGAGFV